MPASPQAAPQAPHEVGGYLVGRQLGSGSFGEVYKGRRDGHDVAIKVERSSCKRPQLLHECKLYNSLAGCAGIPRIHWFGTVGEHNAMIMDLLGPSLEQLFIENGKTFSLKTVCMLGEQMISLMEFMHSRGVLHRDIKPNNFVVGRGAGVSRVYVIDFGLSKRYCDKRSGEHIPYRDGRKGLTGTARYTSINNHLGVELSRRDDMEGLGYVFLRMLQGTLPWQGIKAENKQLRNDRIKEKKLATPVKELCSGVPREFAAYMEMCRGLGFSEAPQYESLRHLMRGCMERKSLAHDLVFDWCDAAGYDGSSSTDAGSSDAGSEESRRQSLGDSERRKQGQPPPRRQTNGRMRLRARTPIEEVPSSKRSRAEHA